MRLRSSPRVLVVEDEARMRELLVRAVGSWGFEAAGCRSGEEAVRSMEGRASQIVLLDLNLPGMGGMECFEQVRRRWPGTQVIILTGFGDLESAKRAIHLDVVEFLTKPCHLGELEVAIDRASRRLAAGAETEEEGESESESEPERVGAEETPASTLGDVERQHILATLRRNEGNRAATAAELGISLRTLYYRLSEYQARGFEVD